ncbi:hypothetical protein SAMD00023353_0201520 [Rosellinia necatrix]|uniref:Uncharacterized protein n=1 Tax=Rosellinia necatrix TaxID=77044 RepID=A0A1S7UJP4_ROSNE|nr:hypothetical protein SAMD00023353_0201520 [Rosellinia necatrix]
MDSQPKPNTGLKRVQKRVRFKRDSILEEVRIIGGRKSEQQPYCQQQEPQQQPQQQVQDARPVPRQGDLRSCRKSEGRANALNFDGVPPLFRCKSSEGIRKVIRAGKGAITDVFRGYNALHWYCNAKSTSPGIIRELLRRGIDINALDQRSPARRGGAIIRHTALGYACRNANVKAVHTLLQNGADPRGEPSPSLSPSPKLPREDRHGSPIVYPSPLQELLCQPVHGPRPGRCPWVYHLSELDEETDAYLDDDDDDNDDDNPETETPHPAFRALPPLPDIPSHAGSRPVCGECAADYHIWEPWPATEAERLSARARRRARYHAQIRRLGQRLRACAQLLLDYDLHRRSDPTTTTTTTTITTTTATANTIIITPSGFPASDDPLLWPALDLFLETFWRVFYAVSVCEGDDSDRATFALFGDVCDLLLESAGYSGAPATTTTTTTAAAAAATKGGNIRGLDRLVALVVWNAQFAAFRRGEFFDVDTQLERALAGRSAVLR